MQRLGTIAAAALNGLYPQMTAAVTKMRDAGSVPPPLKAQFDALAKQFDAVRVKFGVPVAAAGRGGGGGGGGGGRGGGDTDNILAQTSALKVGVLAMWEPPTPAIVRQSANAKLALQQAVTEANAFLASAAAMSASLKAFDITLTVPPAGK